MSEWIARFVVVAVVVAWFATTVILPVLIRGYAPPPEMNTTMGIIAGGAVAYIFAKRGDTNGRNGKNGDKER